MPDASFKVIIGFEASGGTAPVGWSETWWSKAGDADIAMQEAKDYVKVRRELLGDGAQVQFAKITNIPPNRLSTIYFFTGKEGIPGVFNVPGGQFDPTQVDLLIRVESRGFGVNARRQWALSGLPDVVTNQLIQQGITGAFVNSPVFKQTLTQIKKNQWGIRKKTGNGPPPTFTLANITDLTPIMVRNRKRGRPFLLFRGKRLA